VSDAQFETWLNKVCQREIPSNISGRIQTFAKELAEGAQESFWTTELSELVNRVEDLMGWDDNQAEYIVQRWNKQHPQIGLLVSRHYLQRIVETYYEDAIYTAANLDGGGRERSRIYYQITAEAFELLNEAPETYIFISYRRKDSSAFALLILKTLKAERLEAFLDIALEPGEDWHAGLKERIEKYDFLILVLGKETLSSKYVLDEVEWAMNAGLTIIPVWHNDFEYNSADWGNIPVKIDRMLQNTHAIRVREESALDYNTAIVELLNRFGITP
jgi:hypothetical protein